MHHRSPCNCGTVSELITYGPGTETRRLKCSLEMLSRHAGTSDMSDISRKTVWSDTIPCSEFTRRLLDTTNFNYFHVIILMFHA